MWSFPEGWDPTWTTILLSFLGLVVALAVAMVTVWSTWHTWYNIQQTRVVDELWRHRADVLIAYLAWKQPLKESGSGLIDPREWGHLDAVRTDKLKFLLNALDTFSDLPFRYRGQRNHLLSLISRDSSMLTVLRESLKAIPADSFGEGLMCPMGVWLQGTLYRWDGKRVQPQVLDTPANVKAVPHP